MAVTMETWLLSDRDALETVFKRLDTSRLPADGVDLELISKARVFDTLEQATRGTQAGAYGKGRHAFKVLGAVSPDRLRRLLWARRFLQVMREG